MTTARNNLSLAFAVTGRIDLGRAEFVNAGDRASALYDSGIVYLAGGDSLDALDAFDQAQQGLPVHLAHKRAEQIRAYVPGQTAGASEWHRQRNRATQRRSPTQGHGWH
jgi:hypothetical protein